MLKEDVLMFEKVGCFVVVIEKIFVKFVEEVVKSISIFVIGIGVGGGVDG